MTEEYQQQATMHPKNPNGGYLKPSDYGADQFFGAIVLTREMVEFLFNQGGDVKINIKVNELKNGQYGAYRRITAKPLTAEQTMRMSQPQAAPQPQPVQPIMPQQAPMMAIPQQEQNKPALQPQPVQQAAPVPIQQAPVQAQPQPAPGNSQIISEDIPF